MNLYLPRKMRILAITQETQNPHLDIKTYRLQPFGEPPAFLPGQFMELGLPGAGEAPFGFSSAAYGDGSFDVTVKRTGSFTEVLHALDAGDSVWLRGPFGNHFPLQEMQNAPLLFVAGGLGLAPLRPLLQNVLAARQNFGPIEMLLAARTVGDHIFAYDYDLWQNTPGLRLSLTIDKPLPGWPGKSGLPHRLLGEGPPHATDTRALVCGPPVMIKAVAEALLQKGLAPQNIYTTLEMRMSCGLGKCGRCNIGRRYVCVDGPVFRLDELADMPDEY